MNLQLYFVDPANSTNDHPADVRQLASSKWAGL